MEFSSPTLQNPRQNSFKDVIPRRVDTVSETWSDSASEDYPPLLSPVRVHKSLFPSKRMTDYRPSRQNGSIPKQQSKILSGVSPNRKWEPPVKSFQTEVEDLYSPATNRDLFSPTRHCYTELSLPSATFCTHTSFTIHHSTCIQNAYNILSYFESIITKCIHTSWYCTKLTLFSG